jgi:hypothetical protein
MKGSLLGKRKLSSGFFRVQALGFSNFSYLFSGGFIMMKNMSGTLEGSLQCILRESKGTSGAVCRADRALYQGRFYICLTISILAASKFFRLSSENCVMRRTYRKRTRKILLLAATEAPSPAHFTKVARAAGREQIGSFRVKSCRGGGETLKPTLKHTSPTSRRGRNFAGATDLQIIHYNEQKHTHRGQTG